MRVDTPLRPGHTERDQAIERHIRQRTCQRIHELHVQVDGARVIVHGRAATYYVKQLAIQAVLEAIEALSSPLVPDVRIGVRPSAAQSRTVATQNC
jgi:hypothetical protein